jgi:hypothetical protein
MPAHISITPYLGRLTGSLTRASFWVISFVVSPREPGHPKNPNEASKGSAKLDNKSYPALKRIF